MISQTASDSGKVHLSYDWLIRFTLVGISETYTISFGFLGKHISIPILNFNIQYFYEYEKTCKRSTHFANISAFTHEFRCSA